MKMKWKLIAISLLLPSPSQAKEIALSFDDAPMETSLHYETHKRTDELIAKLKALNVPPVMIFANPCKRKTQPQSSASSRGIVTRVISLEIIPARTFDLMM